MNINVLKLMRSVILGGVGVVAMTVVSCNPEPDESDLYTFTGETIESLIAQDTSLTAFNSILARVGYDKMMATYGSYTCFAPTNAGVSSYCDSLYADKESIIPYNGMANPDPNGTYVDSATFASFDLSEKIQWLSDSLCLNIARYHTTSTYRNMVSMVGTGEISTMLGFEFEFNSNSGQTVLGNKATILSSDNEATNGLLHIIDNVIPRFTRFIGDIMERNKDTYSIFNEALHMTGLADSLLTYTKGSFEFRQLPRAAVSDAISPANGSGTTGTVECKVGYTLFAESDEVMRNNQINNINDLINYANRVYGSAPEWYDYMSDHGLEVSTGDDYTNRFNALNMFVAYHILGASMSTNQLLWEKTANFAHYKSDAEPYDYYETMLPNTLMKLWEPNSGTGRTIYINRYRQNNTLTDEIGTQGSEAKHPIVEPGVTVIRSGSLQAYNGYVHPINKMLVYDRMVSDGVLNERMRFNCTSLFPELITNRYRYWTNGDGNIPTTHDTSRRGMPAHYFDNIKLYDENICLAYCIHGWWRSYQSDQMQFWGNYDLAFKLPPVPSGVYEIRVVYSRMSYGSFMQYYYGTSSSVSSMQALGLPLDARAEVTSPQIGWTDPTQEDDLGVATDASMHNRGYMRGPYSYYGGTGVTAWSEGGCARADGGNVVRFVLGRVPLYQGNNNWLRVKSLDPDNAQAPVGLDFIELVPSSVLDSQEMLEDWY